VKSAVETLEPTKVKLTVEVTYEDLGPSLKHAYEHIAEQVQVPGFRRGKVPPRIIDQRIGREAVIEHAVNDGLSEFYRRAIVENELRPLGEPSLEVTQMPDPSSTDGELHFTVEVEVSPDIELPALDTLDVRVPSAVVTEEDVTAQLDALRERFGTLVGVDRPAQEGDYVVLDLRATIGDEEVDAVSGISYEIGSGSMLEGLDEALVGLSSGESTTFRSPLAGGERAGEEADVAVTATAVKTRELPAADDDFAQLASEFDTLDELLDDLRQQAGQRAVLTQANAAGDELVKALLAKVEVPVPMGVVEAEVHRHLEGEGRLEDDVHREEVREETIEALRRQIVLDKLVDELEVTIGQQELIDFLVDASRRYGMDPNTFIKTVDESGQIPAMVGEAARSKAVVVALRGIDVKDTDGNAIDLSAFIGTDEDATEGSDEESDDASDEE